RRAGAGNSRAQRGRRQDAGAFAESTGTCSRRTPEPARVVAGAWMPLRPRPRGCPFLRLLSFGQAKESDRQPWMADETHRDVSRFREDAEYRKRQSKWIPAFA